METKNKTRLFQNDKGEQVFKIFSWGKEYILKSENAKREILKLEEYRHILWSYKPPIIIPIILFSVIITGIYLLLTKQFDMNFDLFRTISVNLTWITYSLVSIVYYVKYKKAINME